MLNYHQIFLSWVFSTKSYWELSYFFAISNRLQQEEHLFKPWLWTEFNDVAQIIKSIPKEKVLNFFREIDEALKKGMQFTYPGHEHYPKSFYRMQDPPFFLNYHGRPIWHSRIGLSIVGSREPSLASHEWLEMQIPHVVQYFSGKVTEEGTVPRLSLVSGGARGVDQICHSLAIRLETPTIVFVPSGLNEVYPANLQNIYQSCLHYDGVFVSEFLPSQKMNKGLFARRNRLISGISIATLIVDARRRSGTMLTAQHCATQGRALMVLPTHPFDNKGLGGLDLIKDGAAMVRDAADMVEVILSEMPQFNLYSSQHLQ